MPTIGRMRCLCCGEEIAVKENDKKTVNLSCPWCDLSAYVKAGTAAHRMLAPKIKRTPGGEPPEPQIEAKARKPKGPTPPPPAEVEPPAEKKKALPWL